MRSIGVLFVHGIGTQARGRTLADWGDAITSWIDRWLPSDARHRIEIREAFLTPDSPSEPPYAVVDLFTAGEAAPSTLLLAESWWAETVLPPTYAELVRWSLLVVPWTLASHFLSRLRASSGRVAALLWNFVTMLVALLAMPALLAVLAVVLILGLIPIAQVRQIAVAIQRTLATTIGDSFALLHNDIQRAAIVARVERDLSWIAGKCDETVIVAHSQGAAVAHMVLSKTTLDRDAIMLVTFGSGIGRLREAEQLTRGGFQRKAVPWIFCLGGMLAAIGLWRSLPGFWELRWALARAVAIYLGIVAVFSFFASKLPQWVVLTGTLLAFVPIVPVMFSLFDKSPMVFFLIGAQYAIGLGFAWAEDGSSVQPFEAKVSRWLDLYASRDPVSNGPLFGQKGRRRSIEVCNQRSIISDHTTYWKSTDDFVARIACLLAAKTGVSLDRCVAGDRLRLSRARARRRWRTAWLAAVRAAVVVSPLLIVGTLGLSSAFIAVDAGPLFSVQRNSTEFIGELVSAVTPDFVKAEMSYPPAQFPTSPAVLRTSSLTLLLLLTGAAFLLITWRWRAWDETEVTRLFRRQNVALLEPQFVVFLLVTVAILELIAFAAMGWLAALRYASPEILTALGAAVLKVAAMGAFPWVIFLIAFVVGRTPVAQRIRRAAAAGAVAALIALPFFVWAALQPSAGGSPESSDWIRLEQESTIALSVIGVVWLIPASRLWRFLEPKLAPRAFASLIFLVVVTVPVEMRATMGSSTAQAGATRDIERRFLSGVSAESISTMHRQVTEHPHIAGSARSMEVADRVRRALDGAGLQTEVREYLVHLSTPRSIRVDIISPTAESLVVREPASPEDPDTAHAELGPAFVAYSGSGTVTAPVVYANYGLPPDYARLAAAGVDVRGKIVIARYARSHRAVKLHTAEKAGAAGIIIYSDPADDGYARGLPWPEGPWRADFQSQSGNGKYSWFWHGDPLTPGVAATAGAPTLDPAAAPTLPKIPAVVLSAKEAAKILSRLAGPAVPSGSGFQGALPFTYRLGPGPVTVRLDVQMNASRRPIRNVIGKITGRDPDRWIVLGTHHDAWSFGGMDPGTGLSPTFEVARGLAALARSGWTPERSIVFAFWDAEEFGLIGSTEYAEAMQRELREKAIVYINTDLSMRGRFDGGGTPSLRDFLVQVTRDVPHFDGSGSVYDRWRTDEWQRQPLERRRRGEDGFEVELAALGSGADFVAFQDFLGLPTLQMEFDFEGSYGPYHSNYDTRRFVERHTDPNFTVSQTLARVLGLAVLRLASTNVLPFRYSHYARKMEEFIDGAEVWAVDDQGRARVATDLATARRLAVLARVKAESIEAQLDRRVAAGPVDPRNARPINDALVRLEQQLLDESEPPETRWYRHVIYGWNIYSLYEGQPLPGLAEAIRVGDATAVARETARLERALTRFGTALDDIARLADALIAR